MRFADSIDEYVAEMVRQGRMASPNTIKAYRAKLNAHCDDVGNRDPSKTGRKDVKITLARWPHPNSQRQAHAILTSFYDWTVEEGIRDTNPARGVRRARPREVTVFRPTLEEVVRLMDASMARRRERWVIHLGVLVGLRRQELCGLQGRHLARDGWVWVSKDIGKRGKERWMPVLPELRPVVDEIRATVGLDDYVIPTRQSVTRKSQTFPLPTEQVELPQQPISPAGLFKMVRRVGRRAGLGHDIGPHTLRHAFGDHVARYAGLRAAQALLGHSSVATTEASYTGQVSLDELAVSVAGFTYRRLSTEDRAGIPHGGVDAR